MSYFSNLLRGGHILDVYVDKELTYIMLANGTQITIRGTVVVEPEFSPVGCIESQEK